ncbi:ferredoxin [Candidatus Peregrinibacteria bacterium]|nr:ferredoxin [Candidatus Peregrinibacteria bacterium]
MKEHRITHKKDKCIGCNSCVLIAPQNWQMNNKEGKAELIGAKKERHLRTAKIFECDLEANLTAEKTCPMQAIKID